MKPFVTRITCSLAFIEKLKPPHSKLGKESLQCIPFFTVKDNLSINRGERTVCYISNLSTSLLYVVREVGVVKWVRSQDQIEVT